LTETPIILHVPGGLSGYKAVAEPKNLVKCESIMYGRAWHQMRSTESS
jgi:hypothetical protein